MSNTQAILRGILELYERALNLLHGTMNTQFETELKWQRHRVLKKLLKAQLLEFDRN